MEELKAMLLDVLKDEEKVTKLIEICKDEVYLKQLLGLESAEKAQESLKAKGIEISIEEIKRIYNQLKRPEDEELTDEDLEDVSGGYCGISTEIEYFMELCG